MRLLKIMPKITERKSISLEKYFQEIGKIEVLSPEEEVTLIARYRNGDQEAMHIITKANLKFVVSVAKNYQHQGLSIEDLINEGNLGLIKAVQRFDETKGFKFISYAVWWIRQTIMQSLAEHARMVRLPQNKIGSQIKIHSAVQKFIQENYREPENEELAEIMNFSKKDLDQLASNYLKHLSINEAVNQSDASDDGICMEDMLQSDDSYTPLNSIELNEKHKALYNAIERLDAREQEILKAYFGIGGNSPMKLEDIGERCGLTRERVRQIKENAIKRLSSENNKRRLRSCLV